MTLEATLGHNRWLYHLPVSTRVAYRQDWLTDLSRGKEVIHLGFADYGCDSHRLVEGAWLHARIHSVADHVVGLDSDPEAVTLAEARGLDAKLVDCTDVDAVQRLKIDQADLVIVGELIEHVDNPSALLRAAGRLVRPDGEVVITTPNAFNLHTIILAAGRREMVHPDHLMTFSPRQLFETARRSGLRPRDLLTYRADVEPDLKRAMSSPARARERGPVMHSLVGSLSRVLARPFAFLDPGLILRCDAPLRS